MANAMVNQWLLITNIQVRLRSYQDTAHANAMHHDDIVWVSFRIDLCHLEFGL